LGKLFDYMKDKYTERSMGEDFQKVVGFAKYQVNRTVNVFRKDEQTYDENKLTKAEKVGYKQAEEFFKDRQRTRSQDRGFERE
jgi:hypothetical protein